MYKVVPTVLALIFNENGEVLLGTRVGSPPKPYIGLIDAPGGKIEEYETPLKAIEREVLEETGQKVIEITPFDVHHNFGEDIEGNPGLNICFIAKVEGKLQPTGDLGNLNWFDLNNALEMKLTPWCRQYLEKYITTTTS